jgi:hypothetical protein
LTVTPETIILTIESEQGATGMAIELKPDVTSLMADKEALRAILEAQDAATGFVPDRTITPQKLREMMLADGVRPQDNLGSRDIIQMREGE